MPSAIFSTYVAVNHLVSESIFGELLDHAQDILKASTDMQALMNEASDLAAANLELKAAHQKEMEAQQLKFAHESSQLTGELESLRNKLAEAEKTAAEEISKQTSRAQTAEDALATHMIELSAFHNSVLGNFLLLF